MIRFLIKGLLRDRHRSLFPIIVISLGVALTVLAHCWLTGILGDMIDFNARFLTGHVKVMTRAYADNADQVPNDLALMGVDALMDELESTFPKMTWNARLRFAGLVDVPDAQGETRSQAPCIGLAVNLRDEKGMELRWLNIADAVVRGKLPEEAGEILLGDAFAKKLDVAPGATVTLLSSTMFGGMAMANFVVSGTVRFGVGAMDRGAMIIDLFDAQSALDMDDAAGEIVGYFEDGFYSEHKADQTVAEFAAEHGQSDDPFAPVMRKLTEQNDLGSMMTYVKQMSAVIIGVFVFAMSLVLWNAGLIGGLRRYGEIGVRLAIGQNKAQVYRSMIWESVLIGMAGSVIGMLIGLGFGYLLQVKGIDISSMVNNASMMLPSVFRARVTPTASVIGFLPGLCSTVLGSLLAGIGIFRRNTAQLFKELEV